MTCRRTPLLLALGATAILVSTLAGNGPPRYVWNASASVPIGLYRLEPADSLFITELVAVQASEPAATFLSEGGYLPRGIPMLKRVLALPGQTVCRSFGTITIDQIEVGKARERDSGGRPLPVWQGCRALDDGEVFVMNWQSADSLDGRYFGVFPKSAIVGQALPVWTRAEY